MAAHEIIHDMKSKSKENVREVGLKIDISMAYHRVEREYAKKVMQRVESCDTWVNWMIMCM